MNVRCRSTSQFPKFPFICLLVIITFIKLRLAHLANGWRRFKFPPPLHWRHNERAMASQIISLSIVYLTVYSRHRSKKTSMLRVTGHCEENSPVLGGSPPPPPPPAQRASSAENFHFMTSSCILEVAWGMTDYTLTIIMALHQRYILITIFYHDSILMKSSFGSCPNYNKLWLYNLHMTWQLYCRVH